MQPSLTLCIKDFGNIKEAEIDIAPMMLFIGHNNTGKSYVAMLWWAILKELQNFRVTEKEIENSKHLKFISNWLLKQHTNMFKPDLELLDHFIDAFNEFLNKNKSILVKKLFNYNDINIGEIKVKKSLFKNMPEIIWKYGENAELQAEKMYELDGGDAGFSIIFEADHELGIIFQYKNDNTNTNIIYLYTETNYLEGYLVRTLISFLFREIIVNSLELPFYLPASRSGYILTYKPLTAEAHEQAWNLENKITFFPQPIILFLKNLVRAGFQYDILKRVWNHDISNSLEKNILEGEIIQIKQQTLNDFLFQPRKTDKSLPFRLTSSLVSELAPLVIFLKSYNIPSLIMEEPEAHLHPEMQYLLVRNLVKLFNRGVSTLLTTHSISIFEQLNNLITLFNHPKQAEMLEKFGYSKEELLNPDDVLIYQFEESLEGTTISKLELTETGFIAPTFNKSISDLSKQSLILTEGEVEEVTF